MVGMVDDKIQYYNVMNGVTYFSTPGGGVATIYACTGCAIFGLPFFE